MKLSSLIKDFLQYCEVAQNKSPIVFYEGEFNSGTVNLWTGLGDIDWDSKTWIGTGNLFTITPLEDATDIRATGITVSLNGMSSEIVSIVLQETVNNSLLKYFTAD